MGFARQAMAVQRSQRRSNTQRALKEDGKNLAEHTAETMTARYSIRYSLKD